MQGGFHLNSVHLDTFEHTLNLYMMVFNVALAALSWSLCWRQLKKRYQESTVGSPGKTTELPTSTNQGVDVEWQREVEQPSEGEKDLAGHMDRPLGLLPTAATTKYGSMYTMRCWLGNRRRVTWIMCDLCDQWYHVGCVGLSKMQNPYVGVAPLEWYYSFAYVFSILFHHSVHATVLHLANITVIVLKLPRNCWELVESNHRECLVTMHWTTLGEPLKYILLKSPGNVENHCEWLTNNVNRWEHQSYSTLRKGTPPVNGPIMSIYSKCQHQTPMTYTIREYQMQELSL